MSRCSGMNFLLVFWSFHYTTGYSNFILLLLLLFYYIIIIIIIIIIVFLIRYLNILEWYSKFGHEYFPLFSIGILNHSVVSH